MVSGSTDLLKYSNHAYITALQSTLSPVPSQYLASVAMYLINDIEIFLINYKLYKSTVLMVNIGPGNPITREQRIYLKLVDPMTEDPRTMDPGTPEPEMLSITCIAPYNMHKPDR